MISCDKPQGSGCCAQGMRCAREVCVDVYVAVPGSQPSTPDMTDTSRPTTSIQMSSTTTVSEAVGLIGSGLTMTPPGPITSGSGKTVTETNFPSAITITMINYGEVAPKSRGIRSVRSSFGFTSWSTLEGLILALTLISAWAMAFEVV